MRRYIGLHWLIYPLFLACCAKTTSPTGGPKDTIPPVLIKSIPEKGSIKYDGKEIQLFFSENVILKNQKEQIIVTPDIGKDYKIEANKKTVTIQLEKKLKDSTTYTFSFRDAIGDLNEQNPAQNLKLAFSTGDYIDSLSIEGKVSDPLKSKDLNDITVALYQSDTFDIFKHNAAYLTKSDKKGSFKIENLKPGKYYVYAIDDKSRNLIVDSKSESYGYLSDSIKLTTNLKNVNIPMIRLDARQLKISSGRPYNTYFNIKTTKGIQSYTVKSDEVIPYSLTGEDNTSIKIYNTLSEQDSASVKLNITDSIGNEIDTVLFIKFNKQTTKPEKFDLTTKDFRLIENKGLLTGTVKFTKPLFQINFDSLLYKIDSLNIIKFQKEDITYDTSRAILYFQKTFNKTLLQQEEIENPKTTEPKQNKTESKGKQPPLKKVIENQLYFAKASFISIESDSSRKIEESLRPIKLDQTGILFIDIETKEEYFIVQLLAKDFTIIKTEVNKHKISFEDLAPSDYMIRLIIDTDKNKKWSQGNYYSKQEPEKVIFYKNEKDVLLVNLRANFELGPLLIKY
ncbi:MAG TPA: Ig-like domain-containing domain [Chryseolinea sp.]|nr:Ig-like domain-containing domain [Chryseolinea sp.]